MLWASSKQWLLTDMSEHLTVYNMAIHIREFLGGDVFISEVEKPCPRAGSPWGRQ